MERHGNHGVKMFIDRNGSFQVRSQRPGEGFHPGILKEVNQTSQRAFVHPETGCVVKPPQARTACRANSPLIERPGVEKRRIANGTEEIGIERRGRSETLGANRNPRPFEECPIANAAIVRKKQRENPVRDPANEIECGRSRYRTTREGAPPVAKTETIKPATRLCSIWLDVSAIGGSLNHECTTKSAREHVGSNKISASRPLKRGL